MSHLSSEVFKHFRRDELLCRFAKREYILCQVVGLTASELPVLVTEIRDRLATLDTSAARLRLHELEGLVTGVAGETVQDRARGLQVALAQGGSCSGPRPSRN